MRNKCVWVWGVLFVMGSLSVSAQLASDLVPRERIVPRRQQVEREIDQSRYQLGPVRVQPRLMIRDFGYNDNVLGSATNPVSDFTATAVGGVHFILPLGSKLYVRGDALPEYTWYKDLSDRRSFGGNYNASLLALFNRMSIEATGSTSKSIATVSSELEAPAKRKIDGALADFEIEVLPRFSLYASGQSARLRYTPVRGTDLARVNQLDRDDVATRGGIRYAPVDFFDIRLGVESTQSEFEVSPTLRDNKSQAILLGMHYDRPKAYANLSVGRRKGEPANGSIFPGYETTTGSYFLSRSLTAPVEFQLYGHRRVTDSVTSTTPYFLENRSGGAAVIRIGNRVSLRGFGEVGDNDYKLAVLHTPAAATARKDDVVTFGGGLAFRIYRNIALSLAVAQTDYDSTIDDFDRSVVRVYSGLTFTGDFAR